MTETKDDTVSDLTRLDVTPQIKVIHLCKISGRDPNGFYINTTSNGNSELSPMILGPVKLYDEYVSKSMEGNWQFTKLFPQYVTDGKPNDEYWKWCQYGWSLKGCRRNANLLRYPLGKELHHTSIGHWWDGQLIDVIEGRKQVYVPLYSQLVKRTETYKELKELWEGYKNQGFGTIYLMDFLRKKNQTLGERTGTERLNDPNRSLGHCCVLRMLLTEDDCLKECEMRTEDEVSYVSLSQRQIMIEKENMSENVDEKIIPKTEFKLKRWVKEIKDLYKQVIDWDSRIGDLKFQSLQKALDAGDLLYKIKKKLPHGQFKMFIEKELTEIGYRTCVRYMRLFDHKEEIRNHHSIRSAYIEIGMIKENPKTVDGRLDDQEWIPDLTDEEGKPLLKVNKTENLQTYEDDPIQHPKVEKLIDKEDETQLVFVLKLGKDIEPIKCLRNYQFELDEQGEFSGRLVNSSMDGGGKAKKFNKNSSGLAYQLLTPYVDWYNKQTKIRENQTPIRLDKIVEPTKESELVTTE